MRTLHWDCKKLPIQMYISLKMYLLNSYNKMAGLVVIGSFSILTGSRHTLNGAWDREGCEMQSTSQIQTVCHCYHLTHFAVIMEPTPHEVRANRLSKHPNRMSTSICANYSIPWQEYQISLESDTRFEPKKKLNGFQD